MEKKKLVIFGGTGGLGKQLIGHLTEFDVIPIGSKSVDVTDFKSTNEFFKNNDIDIVINLSGYNYNSPIHKYNENNINEVTKQTNVVIKGTMNILSSCLPYMRDKGYGRIIKKNSQIAVIEEKNASKEIKKTNLCYSGILCGPNKEIFKSLNKIKKDKNTGEYLFTDIFNYLCDSKKLIKILG